MKRVRVDIRVSDCFCDSRVVPVWGVGSCNYRVIIIVRVEWYLCGEWELRLKGVRVGIKIIKSDHHCGSRVTPV